MKKLNKNAFVYFSNYQYILDNIDKIKLLKLIPCMNTVPTSASINNDINDMLLSKCTTDSILLLDPYPKRKFLRTISLSNPYENMISVPLFAIIAHNRIELHNDNNLAQDLTYVLNTDLSVFDELIDRLVVHQQIDSIIRDGLDAKHAYDTNFEKVIFTLSYIVNLTTGNIFYLRQHLANKILVSSENIDNYYIRQILIGFLSSFNIPCIELSTVPDLINNGNITNGESITNNGNITNGESIINDESMINDGNIIDWRQIDLTANRRYIRQCQRKLIDVLCSFFKIDFSLLQVCMQNLAKDYINIVDGLAKNYSFVNYIIDTGFLPKNAATYKKMLNIIGGNNPIIDKKQLTLFHVLVGSGIFYFAYQQRELLTQINDKISINNFYQDELDLVKEEWFWPVKYMPDYPPHKLLLHLHLLLSRQMITAKYMAKSLAGKTVTEQ